MEVNRLCFREKRKREVTNATIVRRVARMIGMGAGSGMTFLMVMKSFHHEEWHERQNQHPCPNGSLLPTTIHFSYRYFLNMSRRYASQTEHANYDT